MKNLLKTIIATFILCACSTTSQIQLQKADSGSTITISIGDTVTIDLPENPTTGYSWAFSIEQESQNIISDISEKYIAPNNNLVGSGGIKEYSFKAINKGEITLTGYYRRPWEKLDKQNSEKVEYIFKIK